MFFHHYFRCRNGGYIQQLFHWKNKVNVGDIEEYTKEWNKLGYTKEQSEELAKLSVLGSASDIEAHIADKILYETLKNEKQKRR